MNTHLGLAPNFPNHTAETWGEAPNLLKSDKTASLAGEPYRLQNSLVAHQLDAADGD
jgi:hypothetical protein